MKKKNSRMTFVYSLKEKNQALQRFKEFRGLYERFNRTIVEHAKCLLFEAEAVNTAVYLKNRSPASGLGQMTPFERWTGRKPDVSHVRVFGSPATVHIPKNKRQKWDKKATKYIFVGYPENVKGYRLYNPKTRQVTTSRDVIIMEKNQINSDKSHIVVKENTKVPEVQPVEDEDSTEEDNSVRGLNSKLQEIRLSSCSAPYDCIALSETWLSESVLNGEILDLDAYNLFRCDRNFSACGNRRGGGVLLAVRRTIRAVCLHINNLDDFGMSRHVDTMFR
jgi:hypothetical protein